MQLLQQQEILFLYVCFFCPIFSSSFFIDDYSSTNSDAGTRIWDIEVAFYTYLLLNPIQLPLMKAWSLLFNSYSNSNSTSVYYSRVSSSHAPMSRSSGWGLSLSLRQRASGVKAEPLSAFATRSPSSGSLASVKQETAATWPPL